MACKMLQTSKQPLAETASPPHPKASVSQNLCAVDFYLLGAVNSDVPRFLSLSIYKYIYIFFGGV